MADKLCAADCGNPPGKGGSRGLCAKCYLHYRRRGDLEGVALPSAHLSTRPRRLHLAPAGMKWCPDCADFVPRELFHVSKSRPEGLGTYCREHHSERKRAWHRKNRPPTVASEIPDLPSEIWKVYPNPDYDDFMVSTEGRVKRYRNGFNPTKPGVHSYLIVPQVDPKGYPQLGITQNGKHATRTVHRMVALTFLGPSDLQVRHLDGNKTNNSLSNLAYGTNQENQLDNVRHNRENREKARRFDLIERMLGRDVIAELLKGVPPQ